MFKFLQSTHPINGEIDIDSGIETVGNKPDNIIPARDCTTSDSTFVLDDADVSESSCDSEIEDDLFVEEVMELGDQQRISSIIDQYEVEDGIFNEADLIEWKIKERILIERKDRGYSRCEKKTQTLTTK